MQEVRFYHLTRAPLEATLPNLLEISLQRGWRVLIQCGSADRMRFLDERLWTANAGSFLPHGVADAKNAGVQPILLTLAEENPNCANVLMLVDGAQTTAARMAEFDLVCVFFDGNDIGATNAARNDWKAVTSSKLRAVYWAQDDDGQWTKKAESGAG